MWKVLVTALAITLFPLSTALAHFGLVVPSKQMVLDKKDATITLDVAFTHPFEGNGMHMEKPKSFTVYTDGTKEDLTATLTESKLFAHKSWKTNYTIKKPGVYQFVVQPVPYFEPAEDCYIVHTTQTIVAAFGEEDGWETPLGLNTEIVPLTRPFGNYSGNVFQGTVLLDGKPVAGCDVEIEYYNPKGEHKAPNDYFVTQVVKTDANGVFTYAVPWDGWWGFAALNTSKEKLDYKGSPKDVEMGAVLWMHFAKVR